MEDYKFKYRINEKAINEIIDREIELQGDEKRLEILDFAQLVKCLYKNKQLSNLHHGNTDVDVELSFCRVEALVGRKIVAVAAGYIHTVVTTDTGEVLTFGGGMQVGLDHAGEADAVLPCVVDLRYLLGPQ